MLASREKYLGKKDVSCVKVGATRSDAHVKIASANNVEKYVKQHFLGKALQKKSARTPAGYMNHPMSALKLSPENVPSDMWASCLKRQDNSCEIL